MRMLAFSLAMALSLGGVALAQTAPPPAPPVAAPAPAVPPVLPKVDWTKMRGLMKQMQASARQMRALRKAERASMLGALSAVHRASLAAIVGALAVSLNPNRKAAVAKIDAMLSPKERAAILAAQATYRSKVMAAHRAMFKQLAAAMPPRPAGAKMHRTRIVRVSRWTARARRGRHKITAGMLLLAQTGFGGGRPPMGGMRFRLQFRGPMGPGGMHRRRPMGPGPAMPPPAATASPAP